MWYMLAFLFLLRSQASAHSLGTEDKSIDRIIDIMMGKEMDYEHDEDLNDEGYEKSAHMDNHDHGRSTTDADDDEEAALDADFHAMIGVPHSSEDEDELLADNVMKHLVQSGELKQEDVDLAIAMDSMDHLVNAAELLSRKERAASLTDDEVIDTMKESVASITKAGDKILNNKVVAFKQLEKSKLLLLNIVKSVHEKEVSDAIDEKMRKAIKSEETLDKIIENMSEGMDYKRSKRSTDPNANWLYEKTPPMSIKDMLNEFYMEKNVVKAPTKPIRHSRSVDGPLVDGDILEKLEKVVVELYEDPTDGGESTNLRSRRETVGQAHESEINLVTRGFSEDQYNWLINEFDLSEAEVEAVKALNEEEFLVLLNHLRTTPVTPEKSYTVDDLVSVLQSARQLVPAELEAAAYGALHLGLHLGGRARVAVDPVVDVVKNKLYPGAKKMFGQAVDSVPDDVKDWAGEGQRIAAKRAQMVVEYAGPRLVRLGKSMDQLQGQLRETAGDALKELVPRIVPALQMVVDELRDTLELAREVIPPLLQKVGEQARPVYHQVKDTMSEHVVQPYIEYVLQPAADTAQPVYQAMSDTVIQPVASAVGVVTPMGRAAYYRVASGGRVVYDEVTPVLEDLATSSRVVMNEQVLPVVKQIGVGARHQAGRIGETIKISVAPTVRDVLKGTLDTLFTGVPKMVQQLSHEAHDAAKVFRGRYDAALGKMRSRQEQEEEIGGPAGGQEVSSVAPPVFRPSKAPKRTYVTSTEL
eukprot:GFUD01022967.1.p1 GENE.GFUD01022967.1~~GFUD01022967.1.p1  ORF type:complete len:755 (-),score=217.62 GFUD01022967.1:65-2329(-)